MTPTTSTRPSPGPATDHPDSARGIRAATAAYLLWGSLTVYWKQLGDFGPFELIAWRISLAALVMAIVITLRSRWSVIAATMRDRALLARVSLAAVLLAVNWTTYVWTVVDDRILESALGYFLAPLGTMAIGVVVLGERLTPLKRFAVGLAAAAVIVLTVSYGRVPIAAVVIAASWSAYGLTKRRVPLTPIESLASETFVLALPATAVVVLTVGRTGGVVETAGAVEWAFLAGTGAITALPLLLFAYAAQRVPFTVLGPLNYLVPLINFGLGWLVYGESLPPVRVFGFVLVWIALGAVTLDVLRARRPAHHDAQIRARIGDDALSMPQPRRGTGRGGPAV